MRKLVGVGFAIVVLGACESSLTHFPEERPVRSPPATTGDEVEAAGLSDTGELPVETDTDTDTDADTDTDTDSDTDTDTDTDPHSGGATLPLVTDGHYTGDVDIDYTNVLPLIGGSATCSGRVVIDIDQTQAVPVVGTIDCDWPLLNLWAQLTLGGVDGVLDGFVSGSDLDGDTSGEDGNQFFVWSDPFVATVVNDHIDGSFSGGTFLVDNYTATFTADLR